MGYAEFLQGAATVILASHPEDPENGVDLYLAATEQALSAAGTSLEMVHGHTRTDIRSALLTHLAPPPILPSDIRTVMEDRGKSLVDLGADYQNEFLQWFTTKDPATYAEWRETLDEYEAEEDPAETLLFCFSNDSLAGFVYDTHDELLAEFCATCPKAARHIRSLLAD